MQITHRKTMLWLTGLGLTLSLFTGCQTWEGGMTLPSGRYLQHTPQYLPQEPDFPLPREQAYQEEKAGLLGPNVAGALGGVEPVRTASTRNASGKVIL